MNKKLKNQIFQEIEKEDNYRDRSHELKSHILFAEKEERKHRFWTPVLTASLAAFAAVAIMVPTLVLNNDKTSNIYNPIADVETDEAVANNKPHDTISSTQEQVAESGINQWKNYFSRIAEQYRHTFEFGDFQVTCYPGILEDETIGMGYEVNVDNRFDFEDNLLSFEVNDSLAKKEKVCADQCGYVKIGQTLDKEKITVIYDSDKKSFEMDFSALS
jgi:hypothetical protein